MPDRRITDLTPLSNADAVDGDLIPIADISVPETKSITKAELLADVTLAGQGVTASAAELNILDGITATTAELNILDGVTATTAELNILDGVTATTAELNILDGVTATTAELNILDGVTVTADELNKGSQLLDNKIINGAFDIWQRATSTTANGYAAADRWANSHTGGTVTQSRQTFSLGATFGQNRPKFKLRQAVTGHTLAGHYALSQQSIEGVQNYSNSTITVLGFARRNSGSGNMAVEMVQVFGSGGSPSATVNSIGSQQVTLTTDWEPFAAVISVPSITGKTLGTAGDDYIALNLWSSAGSDWAVRASSLGLQTIEVELWGIHVRVGTFDASAAFDYVQPKVAEEFALCKRYYQVVKTFLQGGEASFSFSMGMAVPIPVEMRATPTVTTTITANGGYQSTLAVQQLSPNSVGWNAIFSAGPSNFAFITQNLDAEL